MRRSALASPGDERELGILVSRLHSNALDLRRPPWEMHFIEGLEGGRFAIYIKMHHALIDGYTGEKLLARSLSTDPEDTTHPLFFNIPTPGRAAAEKEGSGGSIAGSLLSGLGGMVSNLGGVVSGVGSVIGSVAGAGRSTFDLTKAIVNTQLRSENEYRNLIGSVQAPRSILDNRISRNRRFATQQYELDRLKGIARDQDATLNDVALAISEAAYDGSSTSWGTARQAIDRDVAGQRAAQGRRGRGQRRRRNPGTLGTDIVDPLERLQAVTATTRMAKAELERWTRTRSSPTPEP